MAVYLILMGLLCRDIQTNAIIVAGMDFIVDLTFSNHLSTMIHLQIRDNYFHDKAFDSEVEFGTASFNLGQLTLDFLQQTICSFR